VLQGDGVETMLAEDADADEDNEYYTRKSGIVPSYTHLGMNERGILSF
jgi:hypothetical protein